MHLIQNVVKFCPLILNLTSIKGNNSVKNLLIMAIKIPNVDLVSINAYTKFDEILSIGSQNIEHKQNYDRMT